MSEKIEMDNSPKKKRAICYFDKRFPRLLRIFNRCTVQSSFPTESTYKDAITLTPLLAYEIMDFIVKQKTLKKSPAHKIAKETCEVVYKREKQKEDEDCPGIYYHFRLQKFPCHGIHFFEYRGEIMQLERFSDLIRLTTWRWNKSLLDELIETVFREQMVRKGHFFWTYSLEDGSSSWKNCDDRRKRKLNTIFVKPDMKNGLLEDVKEFLKSQKWYAEKGVPYRRGYLLYGPPGNGKTSLITGIASELGFNVAIVPLSSESLTDNILTEAMGKVPEKTVVLIEDIDAGFSSREFADDCNKNSNSKITLKGLLNAMDGITASEGRILFVTTNYVNKLDPALIRPGRIDIKLEIGHPGSKEIEEMFNHFYLESESEEKLGLIKEPLLDIISKMKVKVSMAAVQGLFIKYKNKPEEALKNAEKILKEWATENGNSGMYI